HLHRAAVTRAGELIVYGFEGTEPPPELEARIATGRAGGVILFARNVATPDQVAELTARLHGAVPAGDPPLLVSVDQEGGRVQRIRAPLTVWPPMARVGERGDSS